MSAESDLYSLLTNAAGVTALVGSRIHLDERPQNEAVPSIAYRRAGTQPINTIHGTTVAQIVTMAIACISDERPEAEAVADAVQTAIAASDFVLADRLGELDPERGLFVATLALRKHE